MLALLTAFGCVAQNDKGNPPPVMVGNDSDAHGCKASAGYGWCEAKQKCLRAWDENCTNAIVPKACTMEAKICPDGSAVGRSGPNCEFAACPVANPPVNITPPATPPNYTLYGTISIGPLCPVEPCARTFDYSNVSVHAYDAAGTRQIASVNANASGYYGIVLAPGSYQVNVTDAAGRPFGMRRDYTQNVSIGTANWIELDFSIDTGIR